MSENGTDDHLSILKARATSANTDTQCKMRNSTRSKDKLSKKSLKKKKENRVISQDIAEDVSKTCPIWMDILTEISSCNDLWKQGGSIFLPFLRIIVLAGGIPIVNGYCI